jgi:hypothetical protein
MAAKNEVTVSVQPTKQRSSSAQRRTAQIATVSTKQAEPKREAVERRSERALNTNTAIDDCTRVVYAEASDDEKAITIVAFPDER